ncbi:MAG: RNA polymerase sigma factor [bacterium]
MPNINMQPDFSVIYHDHKANVWKLVSKYVFKPEDREDLFQEVFLAVHKALPKFRGEAALNTWIYRITVNTALNYLKKQRHYSGLKQVLSAFRLIEAAEPEAPADIEVFKPLEKLNPRQRMILLLIDVEEKSLDEAAALLKIPVGTVKSNLHRAREIIKKEVSKNG